MRPLGALLALLLALPAVAGEGRRVELPAAPLTLAAPTTLATPTLPGARIEAVPPAAQLAPALALAPAQAAAAAPVAAGPKADPRALALAPAELPAVAPGLSGAARAVRPRTGAEGSENEGGAAASASPDADVSNGRALFDQAAAASGAPGVAAEGRAAPSGARASAERLDLDAVVKKTASRPLRAGVFIQQEQEGSLLQPDARDSSGNVFRYYRPAILREDIAAQVHDGLSGFSKAGVALKRAFRLKDRQSEYAAWDAWPLRAKLEYLGRLEKAVVDEKGHDAAWNGKVSLLLERKPGAPDFLTQNPHMEAPPPAYKDAIGARFYQPELVSDKASPARTVNEAIGRTKRLIADTGHAGTQYHVFVKASPEALREQLPRLQDALQLLNDVLFAKAAQESFQNVLHPSLLPWHRGRSERVAALLRGAAADPHVPQADDADSEKHAFIGLRYWGMEDGKLVISFELRGASLPFKMKKQVARDMGTPEIPQRDYSGATRWLTLLSLYAEQLAQGRAPALPRRETALDLAAAERALAARAAQRGMPEGSYYGLADFAKRLGRRDDVAPGFLFPFASSAPDSPQLRALMDALLQESARLKAGAPADKTMEYQFWSAYSAWAADYEARQRGVIDALWRAVSAG